MYKRQVIIGKNSGEYSNVAGSEDGLKRGVSMAYHPGTSVLQEGLRIIGYRNEELGLNTSETLFVGPLVHRKGFEMCFPPVPLSQSNVGVPIPIDFKGKKADKRDLFPIVGTKIPVEINSSESDAPVSVDISSFLQRDPPREAFNILLQIEEVYKTYKKKLLETEEYEAAARREGNTQALERIIRYRKDMESLCKGAVSSLHSTYRGLPLATAKGDVSTRRRGGGKTTDPMNLDAPVEERAARFEPASSYYLPLIDWVTMHRMLSSEAFGPEWGGHQLWPKGDDELKSRRKEALEEFLIKTHSLDTLAKEIGLAMDRAASLRRGSTAVDPLDLLSPAERLVGKGIIPEIYIKKIFGDAVQDALAEMGNSGMAWVNAANKLSLDPKIKEDARRSNRTPMEQAEYLSLIHI